MKESNSIIGSSRLSRIENDQKFTVLAGALIFGIFLFISLRRGGYAMDETLFHYPNLLNFYKNGLAAIFNKEYSAANTPLPYIIVAGIAKIFPPGILMARMVTAVISFAAFLAGMKLLVRLQAPPLYALVLMFYPYFFLNSFLFYAINFGLFFFIISLLLLTSPRSSYLVNFGAGLCLSMAILCQQFYLMVLFAVLLMKASQYFLERQKEGAPPFYQYLLRTVLVGLPALLPLAIFYKWGGLVHPNFKVHQLSFFPTNLTGIFLVTGFYFAPFVRQSLRRSDAWKFGLALVMGGILSIWFRPVCQDFNGPGIFNGIVYHILDIVSKKIPSVGTAGLIFLTATGLMVFYKLAESRKTLFELTLFASGLLLAAVYTMNSVVGERHLLPLLFLFFFLVLPRLKLNLLRLYLPFIAFFGIGYYFYWLFVKYA